MSMPALEHESSSALVAKQVPRVTRGPHAIAGSADRAPQTNDASRAKYRPNGKSKAVARGTPEPAPHPQRQGRGVCFPRGEQQPSPELNSTLLPTTTALSRHRRFLAEQRQPGISRALSRLRRRSAGPSSITNRKPSSSSSRRSRGSPSDSCSPTDYVPLLAPTKPATPRISTREDISREFP
jgi:hypothetical protein